jgi:hypothetical protein
MTLIGLIGLSACNKLDGAAATSTTPGLANYLSYEAAKPLDRFNPCGNPDKELAMYAPPNFEYETPVNFIGAMNMVDPSVSGGTKANPSEPMELFDANPQNTGPELYPARIVVQSMPKMNVEEAEKDYENSGEKDWDYKGRLKTPVGPVPLYEREIELRGFKGEKTRVTQKRYLMCWENKCFAVFTYCPINASRLAYVLEQSAISVRHYVFEKGAQMILPPTSTKKENFGIKGGNSGNQPPRESEQVQQEERFNPPSSPRN